MLLEFLQDKKTVIPDDAINPANIDLSSTKTKTRYIFLIFKHVFSQADARFNLPVYRLETEREKLPHREPVKRVAEKILYFEKVLGKSEFKVRGLEMIIKNGSLESWVWREMEYQTRIISKFNQTLPNLSYYM